MALDNVHATRLLQAHEIHDATWRKVMVINVDGPMRLSRAVLPHLMKQGEARTSTAQP